MNRDRDEEPLFRELDHTADLAIEVDAESPAELFRRAGLALHQLMVAPEGIEPREVRREVVEADGWEDLFHDWLSKLLRLFLMGGFVACRIDVDAISARKIDSRLHGETLDLGRHSFLTEIKAVTYHELSVERIGERWRARVIFDI
jgi:SHS2 domain-containing protein